MEIEFSISFCLYLYMKTYNYIYLITNTLNGKIYVGKHSTDNLNDGYMGSGKLIKLAYNKYGIENFTKKILAFADTEDELNDLEIFYIKDLDARNRGYNLTDGGEGILGLKRTEETKLKITGEKNPFFGKHHSEESKQKMSEARKGKQTWMKGKHHSEESKQKLSKSHKGKPLSKEHKHKIGESLKGRKLGPMTEEHKRKLGESLKGRTVWNKGKTHSEETKRKISEANKGKPRSEETKRKISETLKRKKEAI